MFCVECGNKLSDDDIFCGNCGAKNLYYNEMPYSASRNEINSVNNSDYQAEQYQNEQYQDNNFQNYNFQDDNFNSGNYQYSNQPGNNRSDNSSISKKVIIFILVLLLLAGLGLTVNYLKNKDDTEHSSKASNDLSTGLNDDKADSNDSNNRNDTNDINNSNKIADNDKSDNKENKNILKEIIKDNSSNKSDNIFDNDTFVYELNGHKYALKESTLREYMDDWYVGEHEDFDDLEPHYERILDLFSDKFPEELDVNVINLSKEKSSSLYDAVVYKVRLNKIYGVDCPSIEIPGGITWDSKYEDIVKIYGEPTEDETQNNGLRIMYYSKGESKCFGFAFDTEGNMVMFSAWWY